MQDDLAFHCPHYSKTIFYTGIPQLLQSKENMYSPTYISCNYSVLISCHTIFLEQKYQWSYIRKPQSQRTVFLRSREKRWGTNNDRNNDTKKQHYQYNNQHTNNEEMSQRNRLGTVGRNSFELGIGLNSRHQSWKFQNSFRSAYGTLPHK